MPQQINLYTPVLSTRQRRFSAAIMVQALAALTVVSAVLGMYEVHGLQRQSVALRQTLRTGTPVLEGLRVAIRKRQALAVPAELALAQELSARRAELRRMDSTLAELQQGIFVPGEGYAARLALVARSIPTTAWVTLVKADAGQVELNGFTFDPSVLNSWISQLAASPLLARQRLVAVNVAKVSEPGASTVPGTGGTPAQSARPVWSFSMTNAHDQPLITQGEAR